MRSTRITRFESRRTNRRKLLALVALALLLTINGVSWMQAWSMTHYAPSGQRTSSIEALTLSERLQAIVTGVTIPRPENTHTPKEIGLSYQTHQITINQSESLEAWYVPHTNPRGIVLMFPG